MRGLKQENKKHFIFPNSKDKYASGIFSQLTQNMELITIKLMIIIREIFNNIQIIMGEKTKKKL